MVFPLFHFAFSGPKTRILRFGFSVCAVLVFVVGIVGPVVFAPVTAQAQSEGTPNSGDGRIYLGTGGVPVAPRPPATDPAARTTTNSRERRVAPVWPPRLPGTEAENAETVEDQETTGTSSSGFPGYLPRTPSTRIPSTSGPGAAGILPPLSGSRLPRDEYLRWRAQQEAQRRREQMEMQIQMYEERRQLEIQQETRRMFDELFGDKQEIGDKNVAAPHPSPAGREGEPPGTPSPEYPAEGTPSGENAAEVPSTAGASVDTSDPERMKAAAAKALLRQRNLELARKRYQANQLRQSESRIPFEPIPLTAAQLKDGWCQLFDGKTFLGWRVQDDLDSPYSGGRFFRKRSEEGVVFCDPAKPGLFYTTGQFGNLVLSLEYQCPKDAEILLLLRSPPNPRDLHTSCYTVVLNSEYRRRGAILGRREGVFDDAMSIQDRENSEDFWHQCTVILDGETVKVMIDRNEAVLLNDLQPLGYGHIGLLVAKGPAKFRNILWRPATPIALYDGHPGAMEDWIHGNLSGGESIPREQLPYRLVTSDRTIRLGGVSVLEHELVARNFTFQADYRLDEGAEGGVFLRAHPREPQTGYECSLRSPEEPEVPLPKGYRTGGLRGLAEARALIADSPEWNTVTINVVDRHVQTWLNGIPVCDWGDLRPPSTLAESQATADVPLSARIPYLDPGTIQLSSRSRDKTVYFRNVRITPIGNRFYDEHLTKSESWADQAEKFRNEERRQREGMNIPGGGKQ